MTTDPTDPLEAARRENRLLQSRVLELERLLQRFGAASSECTALGSTLAEREALLAEAERIAHLGSWVWDVPSGEVHWSAELFRILGYDPNTDVASTEAFFLAVHPDDRERVREASASGAASGVSQQVDYRVQRPDGTLRHVTMNAAFLFDSEGSVRRGVGTVLDVTEPRAAARELTKAADFLADSQRIGKMGSFEQNLETGELYWSDEMFRLLQVDRNATPAVASFLERLHDDDRERISALVQHAQADGLVGRSRARLVWRDGSIRHVDMTAVVIRDEQGKPQALRGTVSDVTHLVELEAQFHQSQKMEAVGQLAGGLAHDYNNLLTVILGNAELLFAEAPNQELEEIISAARSATHVTNRLLTFSRHSNRAARIARLGDDVREARLLLERALGKKIELVLDCDDLLPAVFVDGGQVQQILLNLALNARDAMPDGGTLTLRTETRTLGPDQADSHDLIPGEYVTLEVRDTGAGMSQATLEHVFEPFFTTKEPGHGTGLGLAMVFGAMRQSAGFVEATSRPGEGSCFRLWFPTVAEAPPESTRPGLAKHVLEILLVEDTHAVARLAMAMLRSVGHQVRVAASGIDALALWREAAADVLVTDVVMPGMSGVELADRLRKVRPNLPVLFITGYLPDRIGLRVEEGRSAVVMKPFQRSELLAALEGLVEVSAIG